MKTFALCPIICYNEAILGIKVGESINAGDY